MSLRELQVQTSIPEIAEDFAHARTGDLQCLRRTVLARANTSGVDFTESCDGRASAFGVRVLRKMHRELTGTRIRLRAATAFWRIEARTATSWFSTTTVNPVIATLNS